MIVERLPLYGAALARLLHELGADVVGRSSTLTAGLRCLASRRPDLVVLDRDSADGDRDVLEAIHAVSAASPTTRIVLVLTRADGLSVRRAQRAGVCGCLLKSDNVDRLRRALKHILRGEAAYSEHVRARRPALRHPNARRPNRRSALANLTIRELQVLPYIARGFTVRETSDLMHLSPKTVEVYKMRLMRKLDIHDRVLLTRFAIREKLIPVWED